MDTRGCCNKDCKCEGKCKEEVNACPKPDCGVHATTDEVTFCGGCLMPFNIREGDTMTDALSKIARQWDIYLKDLSEVSSKNCTLEARVRELEGQIANINVYLDSIK